MSDRNIFPESFFNIPHPSSPVVSIQFRTRIRPNDEISNSSNWEEITFNPNNFFNNLSIEDKGGVYNLSLSLFDKNFAYLENIIVKSMVATRMANNLVSNPEYSTDETDYFEFYVSKSNSANLRVRFGYSEYSMDEHISETSLKSEAWRNRANEDIPVTKSPWLYFQMTETDFNLTPKGLEVNIKGFSVMSNFLQKAKLVETYARVSGPPEYVIDRICERIVEAADRNGDDVSYEIVDRPRGYPSEENGEELIEIMLGGEPTVTGEDENGNPIIEEKFKSLESILNEICSNVRPVKYDDDGNKVPVSEDSGSDAEGLKEENEETQQSYKYSYYINETEEDTRIMFHYQDPKNSLNNQEKIRTYVWLQEGNSIIKNLEIDTETDFASLSVPIVNIDNSNGEITAQVLRGFGSEETEEDEMDFTVGHARDVTRAFENENFDSVFVRHVRNSSNDGVTNDTISPSFLASKVTDGIMTNLNEQVFKGTLTLFGDPFYLFDDSVQPFSYLIKIVVNRPNYLDENGDFVRGGKSYLSGYYAIKKIKHEISMSGFETQLEIMKFNSHGQ